MVRIVPRGHTACADAYLTPAIQRYVQGFCRGFQGQLKVRPPAHSRGPVSARPSPPPACPQGVQVLFMRSDGGLAPVDSFSGSRAVLSGPAGGVVGYSATTYQAEGGQPVIGFDMGGMRAEGWGPGEALQPGWAMPDIQVCGGTPHHQTPPSPRHVHRREPLCWGI